MLKTYLLNYFGHTENSPVLGGQEHELLPHYVLAHPALSEPMWIFTPLMMV